MSQPLPQPGKVLPAQTVHPGSATAPTARTGTALGKRIGALKLQRDPFRMVIFILLVMTISRIHQHFSFLTRFRPALTLTLLAAAYAYMNPRYLVTGSIFRTMPAKVIAGLAITACLSVPFGLSIGGSGIFIIQEFSKTIILAFLVIAAIRNVRDLYTFVWSFTISTGCLAYLSIFVFHMRKATSDGLLRIQNGYSYDSNDIGVVVLIGMVMTLLTLQTSGKKGRVLSLIFLFVSGITIAKTGSRGAFLGFAVVSVALLVLAKHVSAGKRLAVVLVMFFGLLYAAPSGYWDQMATILHPKEDYYWNAPTGRREVMKRGLKYLMRNPVTGIGVDNFPRAEGTLSDRAVARQSNPSLAGVKWSAAHNSFLEALVEMGIPGGALFAMLVFGGLIGVMRLRRRLPRHWSRGDPEERFLYFTTVYLPVAFIGFAVSGAFVSFAYMDITYVLAALNAGLYVSVEAKLRDARQDGAHPGDRVPHGRRPASALGTAQVPPLPTVGPRRSSLHET